MLGALSAALFTKRWALGSGLCSVAWSGVCVSRAHSLARNSAYSEVTKIDVDYFRELLGDKDVVTETEALEQYNRSVFLLVASSPGSALSKDSLDSLVQGLAWKICRKQQACSKAKEQGSHLPDPGLLLCQALACGPSRREHWPRGGQHTCVR